MGHGDRCDSLLLLSPSKVCPLLLVSAAALVAGAGCTRAPRDAAVDGGGAADGAEAGVGADARRAANGVSIPEIVARPGEDCGALGVRAKASVGACDAISCACGTSTLTFEGVGSGLGACLTGVSCE